MSNYPFEAAIFDVDGTLFQTEKVAVPAFHHVFDTLREQGLYQGQTPADDKLTSVFGMTIQEVWETLLPDASMDVRDKANELFAQKELQMIDDQEGALYKGVKETLQALKNDGVKLFIACNGEGRYVEAVTQNMGIADLFTKRYAAGEYKTEKKEQLVAILLQEQNIRDAVMVGDRKSDMVAGKENNLPRIGCDFGGFAKPGELDDATAVITEFSQLLHTLQTLKTAMVK